MFDLDLMNMETGFSVVWQYLELYSFGA